MALFGLIGRPNVARLRSRRAIRRLRRALAHRDPDVRCAAAEALGELGEYSVLPDVGALLDDRLVQGCAARALVALAGYDAVAQLSRRVRDGAPEVLDALEALGWSPGEDAAGAWAHRYRGHWDALTTHPSAEPVLVDALGSPDAAKAARALHARGWEPERTPRGARYGLLTRQFERVGSLGPVAAPLILEELPTSPWREDLQAALVAIGDVGAVLPGLCASDPIVREVAARVLGLLAAPEAARSLVPLLEDPVPPVRAAAAEALGACGQPLAVAPLRAAMLGPVGPPAAAALGRIGGREAVDALLSGAVDAPTRVRVACLRALGDVGDPRATVPLVPILRDGLGLVRMHAATALGRLGTRAAVEELTQRLLDDPDPDVRVAAARALGAIGDPRGVSPLVASLSSFTHAWVRREAAAALARFADVEGLDPATAALVADQRDTLALMGMGMGMGRAGVMSAEE